MITKIERDASTPDLHVTVECAAGRKIFRHCVHSVPADRISDQQLLDEMPAILRIAEKLVAHEAAKKKP